MFPQGFRVIGLRAGLKKSKDFDLGLIYSDRPCPAAGLFTQNRVKAAPVILSQKSLKSSSLAQAVLVNSGCANACTGARGLGDAEETALAVSGQLGIKRKHVLLASTGVIGEYLPMDRMRRGIKGAIKLMKNTVKSDPLSFTKAIMTTDTVPKMVYKSARIGNKKVNFWATCKGAGMINPKLATMLSFILTDLKISSSLLKRALVSASRSSFNALTDDGQTSTNDTVLILASGLAGNRPLKREGHEFTKFQGILNDMTRTLAELLARDGEGARKLIILEVCGAASPGSAQKIAKSIALSPLVKTAVAGEDPNWGRVLSAIGDSGVKVNPDRIDLWLNGMKLCCSGKPGNYSESAARKTLKKRRIRFKVNLRQGKGCATVYTCDLTEEYVRINASYRS